MTVEKIKQSIEALDKSIEQLEEWREYLYKKLDEEMEK